MAARTFAAVLKAAVRLIAPLDAEVLLACVQNRTREYVLSHPEAQIGYFKNWRFGRLVRLRRAGVPVAYLTGRQEFFGRVFYVNRQVLIPRPDTEILVEAAAAELRQRLADSGPSGLIRLVDVGTGSGCIPISLLFTASLPDRERLDAWATDVSRPALRVARRNARRHLVAIRFVRGHLWKPLPGRLDSAPKAALIITANLPYLTAAQHASEPTLAYEPRRALVGGERGLSLYNEFLSGLGLWYRQTKNNGCPVTVFLEIDPGQTAWARELASRHLPGASLEIKKDLGRRDRVIIIRLPRA
ncbi:MAG: Release factor glutamine methyltransferase [Candidatus Magasanikbacteria bacterium GW2011_GWA2_56_11]|uniref:Release factor glutamine methyltransferase n=1 Tax=Candidatus Magasanikbacteria bacterium GW2011_GWA2_56_11 TaxID=1619044 RepID=A0A0G2BBJ8_9BACT|nr:MAG: Release factor glutamine methyltransferase [Candidatus Magasanikbacteria bacterium GW2011_GWA2_56_11]